MARARPARRPDGLHPQGAPALALETVAVPAGFFWQGCSPPTSSATRPKSPGAPSSLPAFRIGKLEVTQQQYERCLAAGHCTAPTADFDPRTRGQYPVTSVTWFQAVAFCEWAGMRLPTSAEWEKAARGSEQGIYPWGDERPDCTRANASTKCGYASKPAGSVAGDVSGYGVRDLAGNVEEWVSDWYGSGMTEKVVRGGAFNSDAWHSRTSFQFYALPKQADTFRGFRCAGAMP